MSGLVRDLTKSMEETPPPPHSLGAHLLKAHYTTGDCCCCCQVMNVHALVSCCAVWLASLTACHLPLPFSHTHTHTHTPPTSSPLAGEPLDRDQIMAEIGIMWGAGFEVRLMRGVGGG